MRTVNTIIWQQADDLLEIRLRILPLTLTKGIEIVTGLEYCGVTDDALVSIPEEATLNFSKLYFSIMRLWIRSKKK